MTPVGSDCFWAEDPLPTPAGAPAPARPRHVAPLRLSARAWESHGAVDVEPSARSMRAGFRDRQDRVRSKGEG